MERSSCNTVNSIVNRCMKPNTFVRPTCPELVAFRKAVEANDAEFVRKKVEANPHYLISPGDMPTVLKEGPRYNALHLAAIRGSTDVCRFILRTIGHPQFIELLHGKPSQSIEEVNAILLDLYLNMPDKCRSETPLHFASKYGSVGVISQLIAYPQCKEMPNADGLLPQNIICIRAYPNNDTPEIKSAITALLSERYFVPVLRAVDNSVPAIIGDPFIPAMPPSVSTDPDKFLPEMKVTAYAGPMSLAHAKQFYRRWKKPPRLIVSLTSDTPGSANVIFPLRKRCALFPDESKNAKDYMNNEINANMEDGLPETNTTVQTLPSKTSKGIVKFKFFRHMSWSSRRNYGNTACTSSNRATQNDLFCNDDKLSYSYTCDETNSVYDAKQLSSSPSIQERQLRTCNLEKGLEIIGRKLSQEHSVGWQEYWSFLKTFTNISTTEGLKMFEAFLEQKQNAPTTRAQAKKGTPVTLLPVNPIMSLSVSSTLHALVKKISFHQSIMTETITQELHSSNSKVVKDSKLSVDTNEQNPQRNVVTYPIVSAKINQKHCDMRSKRNHKSCLNAPVSSKSISEDEDEELYYSCDDSDNETNDYNHRSTVISTSSPNPYSNIIQWFERYLTWQSDDSVQKENVTHYCNYICGLQPGKDDQNVFSALEFHDIDQELYPCIHSWKLAMITRNSQDSI